MCVFFPFSSFPQLCLFFCILLAVLCRIIIDIARFHADGNQDLYIGFVSSQDNKQASNPNSPEQQSLIAPHIRKDNLVCKIRRGWTLHNSGCTHHNGTFSKLLEAPLKQGDEIEFELDANSKTIVISAQGRSFEAWSGFTDCSFMFAVAIVDWDYREHNRAEEAKTLLQLSFSDDTQSSHCEPIIIKSIPFTDCVTQQQTVIHQLHNRGVILHEPPDESKCEIAIASLQAKMHEKFLENCQTNSHDPYSSSRTYQEDAQTTQTTQTQQANKISDPSAPKDKIVSYPTHPSPIHAGVNQLIPNDLLPKPADFRKKGSPWVSLSQFCLTLITIVTFAACIASTHPGVHPKIQHYWNSNHVESYLIYLPMLLAIKGCIASALILSGISLHYGGRMMLALHLILCLLCFPVHEISLQQISMSPSLLHAALFGAFFIHLLN